MTGSIPRDDFLVTSLIAFLAGVVLFACAFELVVEGGLWCSCEREISEDGDRDETGDWAY